MDPIITGGIFKLGGELLTRLFPDPVEREKAKQQIETMHLEARMSALVMEAKSADPWTSRARPSFLYVIYAMILMSIPMGILAAFNPELATAIATGMQAWLKAIPESLWALFGVGYLGYAGARSYDKGKIATGKQSTKLPWEDV